MLRARRWQPIFGLNVGAKVRLVSRLAGARQFIARPRAARVPYGLLTASNCRPNLAAIISAQMGLARRPVFFYLVVGART